jgi:hypothetical protein
VAKDGRSRSNVRGILDREGSCRTVAEQMGADRYAEYCLCPANDGLADGMFSECLAGSADPKGRRPAAMRQNRPVVAEVRFQRVHEIGRPSDLDPTMRLCFACRDCDAPACRTIAKRPAEFQPGEIPQAQRPQR